MNIAVILAGKEISLRYGHIILFAAAAFIVLFFMYYFKAIAPKRGTTEWVDRAITRPRLDFKLKLYPMERSDAIPLGVILVVFLIVEFFTLGDFTAPTTFYRFETTQQSTVIKLQSVSSIEKIMYYTGLNTGNYRLEHSLDGNNWVELPSADPDKHPTAMEQSHANVFKWRYADIDNAFMAQYLKITALNAGMELGEVSVFDSDGNLLTPENGAPELFDEQEITPERPSYMNGMYFDEIYHGRTAFETVRGMKLYETVHPPLGKTIISIGVTLFGMTPFGWRCVGALFGVAMLAVMYVLLKNMFGRKITAVCGTLMFGFEFMRFTQTRIATVDTYGVFFIMLSFLFIYRFAALEHGVSFRVTLKQLALSGLFFGLGAASKWITLYAGVGLLAVYVLKLFSDYRNYYENLGTPGVYFRRVIKILLFSLLFFVVIPLIIYILAYIPFGTANGMTVRGGMLFDADYYELVWALNVNMFKYHANLQATHPYSSAWYQWIIDARPILYYYDASIGDGLKSAFSAFTNPLITWAGLAAIFTMLYRTIIYRDNRALVICISYFAQLAPWMLITRCVFAYHYFPSVVFLVVALAHMLDTIVERGLGKSKRWVYGFTAACGALFVLFYPVLSGITVPTLYTKQILQWFNSWVF